MLRRSGGIGPRVAVALLLSVAVVGAAHADLSGAWSGTLAVASQPHAVALTLTQSGRTLTGTLALQASDPTLDGSYAVHGRASGRRVRLSGVGVAGVRVLVRAAHASGHVSGIARLVAPGRRVRGRIALSLQTTSGDGSACDAVLTENAATFALLADRVLEPVCATCHTAGGQASATRLRITRGDALATARSVATVVDPLDPAASLLVTKPTQTVPHGGGRQVAPGSVQEDLLRQWATLVHDARCVSTTGPAAGPYAEHCASCHGADGSGLTNAPDIRCTVSRLLIDAVRSGRGSVMPSFGSGILSDADLRVIAGELATRCSGEPQDVYAANCASCHGGNAGGTRRGPALECGELGSLREVLASGEERMPAFPSLVSDAASLSRWLRGICEPGGGD